MKLSEVFKTRRWQRVCLMDFGGIELDTNPPPERAVGCCLLGGCVVADNIAINKIRSDHGGFSYDEIMKNSHTAQLLADYIAKRHPKYSTHVDSEIIWVFNDSNSKEAVEKLIRDFEKEQEMATMLDVAGQADLTDDDVYETLEELINLGQPFTAYDVTQALRAAGFWAEHSSVRGLVYDYAKRENLQCQNTEVRPGVWARQYVPAPKVAVTVPTPSQVVIPPATTNGVVVKGTAGQSSGVKLHPTKRGGVGIPAALVRQIGLYYHQYAIIKDNGVIRAARHTEISNYTVDRGNRIVVTATTLKKLGLNKDSVYARVVGNTLELKSQ